MIIDTYIFIPWFYYDVKVRNEMSLFFGENQRFFIKINRLFFNLTGKVLKFMVIIYLISNVMLRY